MRMIKAKAIILVAIGFCTILVQAVAFGQTFPDEPTWSLQHGSHVYSIAFSPSGGTLASGGSDNAIRLWDVQTQEQIGALQGHTDEVWSVAFSPKGNILASASLDKTVRLWDVQTQEQIGLLQGHTDKVLFIDFSPDGKLLASASMDTTICLWEVETQKQVGVLEGHDEAVLCVAFSPDERSLASTGWDSMEILWDVETQKQVVLISERLNDETVVFSPDGKLLAIGAAWDDDHIRLWDVDKREEVGQLGEPVTLGHTNSSFSIAFSPDGEVLASGGSKDNAIHIWDVHAQEQIASLEGHENEVCSVAFSPGGKWLASADHNGIILLWHVNMPGSPVEPMRRQLITWGEVKSCPVCGR